MLVEPIRQNICYKCKEIKPIIDFAKYKTENICKKCATKRQKERRDRIKASPPVIPINGKKKCSKCQKVKSLDKFGICVGNLDRRTYHCKRCHSDGFYKRTYNISLKEVLEKAKNQGGVCQICKKTKKPETNHQFFPLVVDHCHITGKIRGLLCSKCNRCVAGVEYFLKEKLLDKAIEYIKFYST